MDCRILSYGHVLQIPVTTDDQDMTSLAKLFEVEVWTTLELIHQMLECGHIDMEKIRSIVAHWSYLDDRPSHFVRDYRKLFGEAPPP